MERCDKQPDFKGDRDHLKILQKSIDADDPSIWNLWKAAHQRLLPDLCGINLNKDSIALSKLFGYNFEKVNLQQSSFYRQTIEDVNFNNADMENVDLSESVIDNCSFKGANLRGCNAIATVFKNSTLRNAGCIESIFMKTHFFRSDVSGISLFGTHLEHCSIKESKCECIYLDKDRIKRVPKTGEFSADDTVSLFTKKSYFGE